MSTSENHQQAASLGGLDPGRVPQREVDSTKRVLWQDANIFIWSESELKSAQSERPCSWIQMQTVQTSAVWRLQKGSGCQIRSIRASDVIVTRRRGSPPEQRTRRSFLQPKTFNIRKMWKTLIKRLTPKYFVMKLFSYISHFISKYDDEMIFSRICIWINRHI